MIIPFGEYLPDLPPLSNPGTSFVKNVIPRPNSYQPFQAHSPFTAALTARCQGAFSVRDKSGAIYIYAGTSTKLFSLNGTAWADVSVGGGSYTAAADQWRFLKFGEKVIAINGAAGHAPQVNTLTTLTTAFANLGGSPPKASCIALVKNQIVLGNVNDGTPRPERVVWSGLLDETAWTPDPITQSDVADLLKGSDVINLAGGEFGLIFQRHGVSRMTYVGSPIIFQIDPLFPERGTIFGSSMAQWGNMCFFFSAEGFHMVNNGAEIIPIGNGKVDKTVLADFDAAFEARVFAACDPKRHLYVMIYPGLGHNNGQPNKGICYDWSANRWAPFEDELDIVFPASTQGVTLEGLDAYSSSLDALIPSLDSPVWFGGHPQLAAIDADHKLGFFDGAPMPAQLETTEAQLTPGQRTFVRAVRPIVDGGATTVKVGIRNRQQDAPTFTPTGVSPNATGFAPCRKNARYHRFRVDWQATDPSQHAIGAEPEGAPAGNR